MFCLKTKPNTIEECNFQKCSEWTVSEWSEVKIIKLGFLTTNFIINHLSVLNRAEKTHFKHVMYRVMQTLKTTATIALFQ